MSQNEIRYITRPHPYAVVSITDPRTKRVTLHSDPNRVATLWQMFQDVGTAYESPRDGRSSYFTIHDADAILDFVAEQASRVTEIIVHCDTGTSRSRGVALALAHIEGDATAQLALGFPNTHVVRTLLERHAARSGTTVTMPCIVRSVKRCLWHIDEPVPKAMLERRECGLCGGSLDPVSVDIMTNCVVAAVAPRDATGTHRSERAFA